MNTKIKMRMLSILLCFVMLGMLPMTTMARTVIPVEPDGGMNLRVDNTGKLLWDSVAGSTGYNVDICKYPGDFLLTTDSVGTGETSYALFGKLDDLGYDNGTYRVKVNVSGSDPEFHHKRRRSNGHQQWYLHRICDKCRGLSAGQHGYLWRHF